MSSAAIVIIGNEILSAKVQDENGPFLLARLRALGIEVRRQLTVLDEIDEIVGALTSLRREVDWIMTTGGIGPTHDDVTVTAVARALGRRVVRSPELIALIDRHYPVGDGAPREAAYRLANVPEGAELVYQPGVWIPAVVVERIALLPGVPELCRLQFEALPPRLHGAPFTLRAVFVSVGEPVLAFALDAVAEAHPDVALGSYPRFDFSGQGEAAPEAPAYKVKLTLESRDAPAVARALEDLLARLPEGFVLRQE
jgi:molybdenum cofactor synthesis domain-containing protein